MAINIAANTSKHLSVLLQCLHAYLMAQFTTIVIKTIMAVAVHDSRREFRSHYTLFDLVGGKQVTELICNCNLHACTCFKVSKCIFKV